LLLKFFFVDLALICKRKIDLHSDECICTWKNEFAGGRMELFPFSRENKETALKSKKSNQDFLKEYQSGHYREARNRANEMLIYCRKNKYLPGMCQALINLGRIESYYLQFSSAIEYFLKAKKLSDKTDFILVKANTHENLGVCYAQSGNLKKGLDFILKSLEYNPDNARTVSNAGNIYMQMGKLEKALNCFQQSLELHSSISDKSPISFTIANIGQIYYMQKKYDESRAKYSEALQVGLQEENERLICTSYLGLTVLNIAVNEYDKALELNELALKSARKHDINFLIEECLLTYSDLYKQKGEFKTALHYKELFQQERERLLQNETAHKLQLLQQRHSVDLDERDLREKKLEKSCSSLSEKYKQLQSAYAEASGIGELGLFSDVMRNIVSIAEKFHADRNVPVLIEGETGTGKEIIARIIHHGKSKASSPFVVINCAAISPTLFESELFGYEEGAFTGSRKRGMAGKFEMAQGGSLFLDEIGELPLDMQPKLLRALQHKEIYRIGGSHPIKLDVRIICATNRDLKEEMNEHRFRRDLFYRLNTGRIFIPPLSERKEEIGPLAQMFLMKFAQEKKRDFHYIEKDSIKLLEDYHWVGNVRELENCIERVVLLYNDQSLQPHHLNFLEFDEDLQHNHNDKYIHINLPTDGYLLTEINKQIVTKVLKLHEGNKTSAAKYLGVSRNTILNILKR